MATDQQRERWHADQARIQRTADALRRASNQQHAVSLAGHAPVVPTDRYRVLALLDELSLAAGRGDLPDGVRRAALAVCEGLDREIEGKTR